MKVSQAIRLSIGVVREDRSLYLFDGAGCALGTAYYSLGHRFLARAEEAEREWPWLRTSVQCPEEQCYRYSFDVPTSLVISHLHHTHHWSREVIADWIETLEKELEPEEAPHAETQCATSAEIGRL